MEQLPDDDPGEKLAAPVKLTDCVQAGVVRLWKRLEHPRGGIREEWPC